MGHARLATYLNDHLAGATGAIELLDRLAATDGEPSFRAKMRGLRSEIDADRRILEDILERAGESPSSAKRAAGWLAEKLARLKIGAGPGDTFARFESLEVLSLGVLGKRALWRVLSDLDVPALDAVDFAELGKRAERQWEAIEVERLRLAPAALGAPDRTATMR